MTFSTDYHLEDYILSECWDALPKDVQTRAVVCAVDLMGALILGSRGRQFEAGYRLARKLYRDGSVPVVGSEQTFSFSGAVSAMGHAANSFDIDDGHNLIKGHPGASVIAGTLAASLDRGSSYREFLTALVVAYETAIRSGMALQDYYQYLHSTGAYGAFGTAAAVGRLFGLDRKTLNTALSIADFHAPMTPVMRAVEYPSMNKDGVPFGAMVGAAAVLEALAGISGKTYLLEMDRYRKLQETLGRDYEIMRLYFKPYTCCRWAHQPIKAALDLVRLHGIRSSEIARVRIFTFRSAAQLYKKAPTETDEAQYNIAYPVAAAIVHGDVGYRQVIDDNLDDPEVLSLMDRMEFVVDPELDRQFPAARLARVELRLRNGTTVCSEDCAAPGEASDGIGPDWIKKKFVRITEPFLSLASREEILRELEDPEGSIGEKVQRINQALTRDRQTGVGTGYADPVVQ